MRIRLRNSLNVTARTSGEHLYTTPHEHAIIRTHTQISTLHALTQAKKSTVKKTKAKPKKTKEADDEKVINAHTHAHTCHTRSHMQKDSGDEDKEVRYHIYTYKQAVSLVDGTGKVMASTKVSSCPYLSPLYFGFNIAHIVLSR